MGGLLFPLIMVIAVFYFMLIRPENKRKKEAEQLRSSLKEGDEIITIGGITGIVVNVKADQVRIEFQKWALSSNESANKVAKEAQRKREEEKAKAKAAKKAAKN